VAAAPARARAARPAAGGAFWDELGAVGGGVLLAAAAVGLAVRRRRRVALG
jgi:hypothetical protein